MGTRGHCPLGHGRFLPKLAGCHGPFFRSSLDSERLVSGRPDLLYIALIGPCRIGIVPLAEYLKLAGGPLAIPFKAARLSSGIMRRRHDLVTQPPPRHAARLGR